MYTLLVIGYVWPEPTATAAGSRMLQIIEQFQKASCKVQFACAAQQPQEAFDLSSIGVAAYSIALNSETFDVFLKEQNPSMVMYDRFLMEEQFGWRVREVLPQALQLLDSEDLHFLRKARQEAVQKNRPLPIGKIHSNEAKREIASIYRCDATFTISEYEMQYLQTVYQIPAHLLWYCPFLLDEKDLKAPVYEETQDFMFVGNFIHAPNWDAVLVLKTKIWPKIRKALPKANLYIYGGYPSDKVFQLHNPSQGFLVKGRAPTVSEAMQGVRVCLAPLRFGAGLKGKLIDAMQYQCPFVTTKIGAEGMFGSINFLSSIADQENEFVQKSVTLYTNQGLWEKSIRIGNQVLQERFSKEVFTAQFQERLTTLLQEYQSSRKENFIGAMLSHHTMQSTKYLSKWIEEKNK